jgi:hypothetical protein
LFFFHWYTGVLPPLYPVAVYVTESPAQTGFCDGATDTEGTTTWLTVICTLLLVALAGEGQVALLVITHQTESLLFNDDVMKVADEVTCITPFLYHV